MVPRWDYMHSHVTPASWPCQQLWLLIPLWLHSKRDASLPVHRRSSRSICPEPWPKWALWLAFTAPRYPSWRHTTFASLMSQESSHTVFHWLVYQISTLPCPDVLPPTSWTEPLLTPTVKANGIHSNYITYMTWYIICIYYVCRF